MNKLIPLENPKTQALLSWYQNHQPPMSFVSVLSNAGLIDETSYLLAAQTHYQLAILKPDFDLTQAQSTFLEFKDQITQEDQIPLAYWDQTLFIAGPDPELCPELPIKVQFILAHPQWVQEAKKQLDSQMNHSNVIEAASNPPLKKEAASTEPYHYYAPNGAKDPNGPSEKHKSQSIPTHVPPPKVPPPKPKLTPPPFKTATGKEQNSPQTPNILTLTLAAESATGAPLLPYPESDQPVFNPSEEPNPFSESAEPLHPSHQAEEPKQPISSTPIKTHSPQLPGALDFDQLMENTGIRPFNEDSQTHKEADDEEIELNVNHDAAEPSAPEGITPDLFLAKNQMLQNMLQNEMHKTKNADLLELKSGAPLDHLRESKLQEQKNFTKPKADEFAFQESASDENALDPEKTILTAVNKSQSPTPIEVELNKPPESQISEARQHTATSLLGPHVEKTLGEAAQFIKEQLEQLKNSPYDAYLYLHFDAQNMSLLPMMSRGDVHAPKRIRPIPLENPSLFRIAFRTNKPYHGHVVSNNVNQPFFDDWFKGKIPQIVSLIPIGSTKSSRPYGFLFAARKEAFLSQLEKDERQNQENADHLAALNRVKTDEALTFLLNLAENIKISVGEKPRDLASGKAAA